MTLEKLDILPGKKSWMLIAVAVIVKGAAALGLEVPEVLAGNIAEAMWFVGLILAQFLKNRRVQVDIPLKGGLPAKE